MADFTFLKNPVTGKTVISAPRRAKRMNAEGEKPSTVCPFCLQNDSGDAVRVIPNKFPFTPNHEIVVLSPDHHKGFDELPLSHVELIFKTYRERYNFHMKNGPSFAPPSHKATEGHSKASAGKQVYIFHNGGLGSGESIPHPHSQIAVVPREVKLQIPPLDLRIHRHSGEQSDSRIRNVLRFWTLQFGGQASQNDERRGDVLETKYFSIFCPPTSEWPDEVWVTPKQKGHHFGSLADSEIPDLSMILSRLIQIFDLRHGHEFPFNFYIYPGKNWYLRLIPRIKVLGGFEVGTGIMVNSQDPSETFAFIREHFHNPDFEKIKREHQADYVSRV